MNWSHDYKRDVSHPNKTQTRTRTYLHDDVRYKQSMANNLTQIKFTTENSTILNFGVI
jgi:hypothetical protein